MTLNLNEQRIQLETDPQNQLEDCTLIFIKTPQSITQALPTKTDRKTLCMYSACNTISNSSRISDMLLFLVT